MSGLNSVCYFLISSVFGFAIFSLWLRILFRYFRISPLHPIGQPIFQITDIIVLPLSNIVNFYPRRQLAYDWVSLGLVIALEFLKFFLLTLLYPAHISGWAIAISVLIALITQPCQVLWYALMARVVMSWINPRWQHPLSSVLYTLTEPMLARIRTVLPPIAGLDFSPLLMLILLKIVMIYVNASPTL